MSDGTATALSHFWYTLSFGLSVQQLLGFSNVTFADQSWSLLISCITVAVGSSNPVILPPSSSPPVLQVAWFSGHTITISTTITSVTASYRNWRILMYVSYWIKLLNSITVYRNSPSAPPSHTKPAYCKCAGFCLSLHNYTSRLTTRFLIDGFSKISLSLLISYPCMWSSIISKALYSSISFMFASPFAMRIFRPISLASSSNKRIYFPVSCSTVPECISGFKAHK